MKNNKSILYLGGFDLPDHNAAAQRVIANAKLFRIIGYKVVLYGLSRSISTPITFEHEGFTCGNLPYPKSMMQWFQYLTSIQQYIPFIEQHHPQIVIAYNHPAVALSKLSNYCKANNIKIISDCTEWYIPQGNPLFKAIKSWDIKKRMYAVHCRMDGIIAISNYLYDFYNQRGVKTILLPPLVDLEEAKWKQSTSDDTTSIRLVFAGSVGKGNKDRVDMVIDALEEVVQHIRTNTFTLDVFGITQEQYQKVFPYKESIPSFVTFHGRKPHQEVIRMLLEADFHIFLRENHLANQAGFPTKFVESISSRTLVLTNPSSNLGDYMREGVNSFKLDISTPENLLDSLSHPLRLSKKELLSIRREMDITLFDYRKYIPAMEKFLSIK